MPSDAQSDFKLQASNDYVSSVFHQNAGRQNIFSKANSHSIQVHLELVLSQRLFSAERGTTTSYRHKSQIGRKRGIPAKIPLLLKSPKANIPSKATHTLSRFEAKSELGLSII